MELFDDSISSLSINTTSSIVQPIMHFLSGAFLLGSIALQNVLGRPSVQNQRPLTRNFVDEFIATERPIALEQLLCNIGPDGCHTPGVSPGAVIASPSTYDPDCMYFLQTEVSETEIP